MRKRWTEQELQAVRVRFPNEQTQAIADDLGRTISSVFQAAYKMGLEKSAAFNASADSGRIQFGRTDPRMVKTQFKPGHLSWNKGTKGVHGLHPNTRRTQFKKGRHASESSNYVPIGSERVTRDGILERKVTDDPSIVPARRWIAVSRLVWVAANGPIPSGHAVIFRPGMHTVDSACITIDKLELVSRGELMRRNSYHTRYPKEVAQLIQLRGALNRKINMRSNSK